MGSNAPCRERNSSSSPAPSLVVSRDRKLNFVRSIKEQLSVSGENEKKSEQRKYFYSHIKSWLAKSAMTLLESDLETITAHIDEFEKTAKEWDDSEEDEDFVNIYKSLCEETINKCKKEFPTDMY